MLGLLFIYFIGKYFYNLAGEYEQNKWGYAILGVVVYYAATFLLGIGIVFIDKAFGFDLEWEENNSMIGLLSIPIGVLACYLFYTLLKRKWEKEKLLEVKETLDDIGSNKFD
jgi:ethanolamine transporter EutH